MRHRGFTLVELLVSIGVIGVLIAVLLPALASARRSAEGVVILSNLRQAAASFSNYEQAYNGFMPFARAGSEVQLSPPGESPVSVIYSSTWDLSLYWAALFHDVAPWREHYATWVVDDPRRDPARPWGPGPSTGVGIPSFLYCRSMYARPALWSGRPIPDPSALLAPVRLTEIRYPSAKVFLFDAEAPLRAPENDPPERIAMAFSDAHAARHDPDDASEPVMPATNDVLLPESLHDTRDGAHGRDY